MDLMFAVAGLLMYWSLAGHLKRESRLLARLEQEKPKQSYLFEVPYTEEEVLLELKHYVKRNHLGIRKSQAGKKTWLFLNEKSSNKRYPLYIDQISDRRTIIEIGAAHLNAAPYILFKRKHKKAAQELGRHFENNWQRKKLVEKLAKQNIA